MQLGEGGLREGRHEMAVSDGGGKGPSLVGQGKSLGFLANVLGSRWDQLEKWTKEGRRTESREEQLDSLGPRSDPRAGSPARLGRACSFQTRDSREDGRPVAGGGSRRVPWGTRCVPAALCGVLPFSFHYLGASLPLTGGQG